MPTSFGRTLIIANPAAHGGRGRRSAQAVCGKLGQTPALTSDFELKLTNCAGDATIIAEKRAHEYDTVLAVGGDGLIHEVVNGLMRLEQDKRPVLGVISVGSGNDYARTLGIAANSPRLAISQMLEGKVREVEVGWVNGTYFMETLSFGVDAAIALQARLSHSEDAGGVGLGGYVSAGTKLFSQAQDGWSYYARFDDGGIEQLRSVIFAVQVGETYGGGFAIAPGASPVDGKLDLCYSQGEPSVPTALATFARARFGLHTSSNLVMLRYARHLELEFEEEPPVQVDGEPLHGTTFSIDVVPNALRVIASRFVRW